MNWWRLKGPALWVIALGYMAAILWVGSRSNPLPEMDLGGGLDKLLHALAYAILSFLLTSALAHSLPGRGRILPASIAVAWTVLCGALDEIHQAYIPARDGSLGDVVADAVGALLGAAAMVLVLMPLSRGSAGSGQEEPETPPSG